jgi:hypothetical protein
MKIRQMLCAKLLALSTAILSVSAFSASATTATKAASHLKLVPPAKRAVPGKHFSVSLGELYVPGFFRADSSGTDLLIFFHGASWCAEQNFYDAHKNGVLVTINMGMAEYDKVFRDPDAIRQVLRSVEQKLRDENVTSAPLRSICLSSFSGGYGAVRQLLNQDDLLTSVSDVVLADSLYAQRVSSEGAIMPASIESFSRFARRAARGECNFWFSQLYPPEEKYRNNTTTLTAKYLIEQTGSEKKPASDTTSRGARVLYRADKRGFHVKGYAGMTTQDHFDHFYGISDLWKQISFMSAGPDETGRK